MIFGLGTVEELMPDFGLREISNLEKFTQRLGLTGEHCLNQLLL